MTKERRPEAALTSSAPSLADWAPGDAPAPGSGSTPEQCSRIWRAMMLSSRLEVCEALLRGESVPVDSLDQQWARRFWIRPGAAPSPLAADELRRLARLSVAELVELFKDGVGEESA